MIFISYRREDTRAVVGHLQQHLEARYGAEQVFVDYDDIPPGAEWPSLLKDRLESSWVLLAVVGNGWGESRFISGKNKHRLRLDDPEDWVRQEICTALGQSERMRVVVVLIDDAQLPETKWNCELDRLPNLQHARVRNQGDFESDVDRLCVGLEELIPELRQAAERLSGDGPFDLSSRLPDVDVLLDRYLQTLLLSHASIQLPLVSDNGHPVVAPIGELRIDLPLWVCHQRPIRDQDRSKPRRTREVLAFHDGLRETHTSSLLVDRAARFDDSHRELDLGRELNGQSRWVIVGDPGCGKSTLLQWMAYHYGLQMERPTDQEGQGSREDFSGNRARRLGDSPLPDQTWMPVLVLARDLVEGGLPAGLRDLLAVYLKRCQFFGPANEALISRLEQELDHGRVLLMVDGLDEIPEVSQRRELCTLLSRLAMRFPQSPMVVTTRVVGFQAVQEELAKAFDHFVVGPLDRAAKRTYLQRWAGLVGWPADRASLLLEQVCHRRVTAKLTDNIFLLAMVAQIQMLDYRLPSRRVDIYRRAIELMIDRRHGDVQPVLTLNEVVPHLELLAYRLRRRGLQRCSELEVLEVFRDLRRNEAQEKALDLRSEEELLELIIGSLGLLNVAGTETDSRGFSRRMIQFFHQSFQEYFASQALHHGRGMERDEGVVGRLRELLSGIEIQERQVEALGRSFVEPVLADYWQEAVRMTIAGLSEDETDDVFRMLLPGPATSEREARPRAVFALQCLADEPPVNAGTRQAVFEAAFDYLIEEDGMSENRPTWMDEALAAVSSSSFGNSLRAHILNEFVNRTGPRRNNVASLALHREADAFGVPEVEDDGNIDVLVELGSKCLSATRQSERLAAGLVLVECFYRKRGSWGFLPIDQQQRLIDPLMEALKLDEPTRYVATWALLWLTGAFDRFQGSPELVDGRHAFVRFDDRQIRYLIGEIFRRPDNSSWILTRGCLLLTRDKTIEPVVHQHRWVYELARIADGEIPRRDLPLPSPSGAAEESVEWLKELLRQERTAEDSWRIARVLGALGESIPEMVAPLENLFNNAELPDEERDEALVYLALMRSQGVADLLVAAMETQPQGKDDYLYRRGVLGLLLYDDVDLLAEHLEKALPHVELSALAFGLAGSRDARGIDLLAALRSHEDERVRKAVLQASEQQWSTEAKTENPKELSVPRTFSFVQRVIQGACDRVYLFRGKKVLEGARIPSYVYMFVDKHKDVARGSTLKPWTVGRILKSGFGEPPEKVVSYMRDVYFFEEHGPDSDE